LGENLKKFYQGKNVLITGGLGFIGSTLAHRLVEYQARVLIVDSLIPEYGGNMFNIKEIEDKVKVNIADVRDNYGMIYLVKGQDLIFNLAGTLSHIDSMKDPFTDLQINCVSQLSILEACRKNNLNVKILFAGTRGQYGKALYLPVDEKHPMHPIDVNGINNIAGEWYHILYYNAYGIKTTSLRLTNTYGPRHQMKHSKQGFLNWFIRLALDNEDIPIYEPGSQKRDFNYVDDVVEAMLLAMASDKANGEVFNLGSGEPVSVKTIAEKVIKIAGKGRIKFIPYPEEKKKIEIGDYYASFDKINQTIGWKPKISIEEGLRRTIDYYKKYKRHYW